jgi:hypothetical protein
VLSAPAVLCLPTSHCGTSGRLHSTAMLYDGQVHFVWPSATIDVDHCYCLMSTAMLLNLVLLLAAFHYRPCPGLCSGPWWSTQVQCMCALPVS